MMKPTIKAAVAAVARRRAGPDAPARPPAATPARRRASTVSVVGFSVLEAANEPVFEDFNEHRRGRGRHLRDVVRRLRRPEPRRRGRRRRRRRALLARARHARVSSTRAWWPTTGRTTTTKGIATSSVVVFVVREGNPENIQTWDDLVKPGVEIITPNPASSGSARWNILAAWAHVTGNGGTRRRGRGVPDQAPRQHHRAARAAAARPPPRSPTAAATCCSPTRTRRSWPSRTAPTSTTSSRRTPC